MVTISPSYVALTKRLHTAVVTIRIDEPSKTLNLYTELVVATLGQNSIAPRRCKLPVQDEFWVVTKTSIGYQVQLSITPETSEHLKGCLLEKGETLALQFQVGEGSTAKDNVRLLQTVLVPVFDNTADSALSTADRTPAVLGELTNTLTVQALNCSDQVIFSTQDVNCQATVQNTAPYGVFANMVVTLRQDLPPGLTRYERLERTNILLLPGQTYSLSFVAPGNQVSLMKNTVALHTTFSAIGDSESTFTAVRESQFTYLPYALVFVVAVLFIGISVILTRIVVSKFSRRKHDAIAAEAL